MSTTITEKRKWTGLICPSCRFVMRVPTDVLGQGAICPACDSLCNTSQSFIAVARPAVDETLDPDLDTLQQTEAHCEVEDKTKVSKWLFLSGAGIAVFASVVIISLFASNLDKDTGGTEGEVVVEEVKHDPVVSIEEVIDNTETSITDGERAEMVSAVQKFLSSEDLATMATVVRHPDISIPRMEGYYKKHALKPIDLKEKDIRILSDPEASVMKFSVTIGIARSRFPIFLEKTSNGYLVDWEGWVGWSEMDWETLLAERPSEEQLVRIGFTQAEYYAGLYDDDRMWMCLRLLALNSDKFIYGYLLRDSFDEAGLNFLLHNKKQLTATVKVRFPEELTSKNQVLITEFLHLDWVDLKGAETE